MKFKKFKVWCNKRACDGCWGMMTAMFCIDILEEVKKIPFWKRERIWKEKYEKEIMRDVVEPIEKKMKEFGLIDEERKKR